MAIRHSRGAGSAEPQDLKGRADFEPLGGQGGRCQAGRRGGQVPTRGREPRGIETRGGTGFAPARQEQHAARRVQDPAQLAQRLRSDVGPGNHNVGEKIGQIRQAAAVKNGNPGAVQ